MTFSDLSHQQRRLDILMSLY